MNQRTSLTSNELRDNTMNKNWWVVAITFFATLALWPLLIPNADPAAIRDVLLFALFAVGLDLFWGRSGILSFGHAAFFGLGAYGMTIATVSLGWPSWAGLIAGLVLSTVTALLLAYFLLGGGVRGEYFTVVTLTTSLIAQQVAVGWTSVTGGDSGLIGVPPLGIGNYEITDVRHQLYTALGLLFLTVILLRWSLSGAKGKLFLAIESAEVKAQTLGYATTGHLIGLFGVSALISGLAGAVYVSMVGFVSPDLIGLVLSTEVILWVATGGRGGFIGAVIGTVIVWQFQRWVSSANQTVWPLFMGVFFIALVFLFPNGIEPLLRKAVGMFGRKSKESEELELPERAEQEK
jgi:ABC-type branched-subunit amino acid transport system permease subunit